MPNVATFSTFTDSAYMLTTSIITITSYYTIFYLIDVSSYGIIDNLEVPTSTFRAFLISHNLRILGR